MKCSLCQNLCRVPTEHRPTDRVSLSPRLRKEDKHIRENWIAQKSIMNKKRLFTSRTLTSRLESAHVSRLRNMTYYVSSGTLNPTHSLTHSAVPTCEVGLIVLGRRIDNKNAEEFIESKPAEILPLPLFSHALLTDTTKRIGKLKIYLFSPTS